MIDNDRLLDYALAARSLAYAPYSKFKVGAAILLKNDKVITGCNVENASYGMSMCAERCALFKMISEGYTKDDVISMVVIGDTEDPISPCGACRQVMDELLNKDTKIILANIKRETKEFSVKDLLPYSFTSKDL